MTNFDPIPCNNSFELDFSRLPFQLDLADADGKLHFVFIEKEDYFTYLNKKESETTQSDLDAINLDKFYDYIWDRELA